ncbi:Predicted arabinose efflux permease, MFS family [Roseateles sp. YR242]|uniref:MFS transporter n=1 Tax=Roseateles sp. YR242 TaxID=1855305 RepID=UPI0008CD3C1A|nr:MFS transporter [Roseateles sp. YR242]SEK56182.1 Predicted arabinose efflux permease, MFS family [Roseateles sp. YR242]
MADLPTSPPPADRRRPWMVALLMAVMVISVLDKTIFAFAGPQIIDELRLTPEQFGFVGSAFYFLYSVSGLVVGFLANRWPTRWILAGMSLVWMLAQVLTSVSGGFAALVGSRMLLGAGCGPGTAVTQHACFKWYSPRERVLPAALIQVAIMLGAVAGALALPMVIQRLGWRQAYLMLAGVGLVWLVLWQCFGREGRHGDPEDSDGAPVRGRYGALLLNRSFVLITVAGFCAYLPTALLYSWVPMYLQRGLGMTPVQSGLLVMVATVGVIVGNLVVSGLSQRALRRGASVRAAMVAPPMLACGAAGVALALMGFSHAVPAVTLTLFLTGSVLVNLLPAFANSIVATLAPTRQRGSMLAIHIGLMTSAGMLAPHVVGHAVTAMGGDIARGFELSVGVFGVALVIAGLLGGWLIDPERSRREALAVQGAAA